MAHTYPAGPPPRMITSYEAMSGSGGRTPGPVRSRAGTNQLHGDLFEHVFATEDAGIGVQSFLEHGPGKATFRGK